MTTTAAARTPLDISLPTSGTVLTWRRLKRDRLAMASGLYILFVLVLCFPLAPLFAHMLGHGPDTIFPSAVDLNLKPAGPWSHVDASNTIAAAHGRAFFLLGADGSLGRDEFLRLLAGGRASLEIAIGATLLAMVIGTFVGCVAGYYRGWTDIVLSRVTEFAMGFPILFLVIALGFTISDRLSAITLHGLFVPGALSLIAVIGIFNWFYIARIVRSQVLALREREFVEAARMAGASDRRIIVRHLLPHLSGTLTVYGSLVLAGTIILEAGLSFLNFGVPLPNASWGNMMSTNWGTVLYPSGKDPAWVTSSWTSIWPAVAIFSTVLAFALFAEGVRRALDPLAVR
jgi:ABC-type dipeptide/oligopeptide/nickel transport system permease subunit